MMPPKSKVEILTSEAIKHFNNNDFQKSMNLYKKALPLCINVIEKGITYYNIGLSHYSLMNYKLSMENFNRSIELGYDCKYELCLSYLHLKDIENAKKLWYSRSEGKRKSYPNLPIKKIKNISELKNKKLLVLNEQGFGDEFLFSKVIKLLSDNCESITYQLYPETYNIISNTYKFDNVKYFTDRNFNLDFVNQFDGFILSGDFIFDCLDYNLVDNTEKCDELYDFGLCWNANSLSPNRNLRSINPEIFKEKIINNSLKVISLQLNGKLDFVEENNINDFSDTLNLIRKCKFVITIDTSVAHLCGMIGKKTYLVYDKYLDWRWNYNPYKSIEYINIKNILNLI